MKIMLIAYQKMMIKIQIVTKSFIQQAEKRRCAKQFTLVLWQAGLCWCFM